MHPQKRLLVWIVLLGGTAVLVSYACILGLDPATQAVLWGGVPPALLPAYVTSMVLAMAGYFAFTYFLLFPADPDRVRIAGRLGYGPFPVFYLLILFPSALTWPFASRQRYWTCLSGRLTSRSRFMGQPVTACSLPHNRGSETPRGRRSQLAQEKRL